MDSTLERKHPSLPKTILFSLILTIVFVICSYVGTARDGSRDAPLSWDSSYYFANSVRIRQAIEDRGIAGFADAWVHVSSSHTPLVPAISAICMVIGGHSRSAAFFVLPIFTFIFILSVVRVVQYLYPPRNALEAALPYATAFVAGSFPIVISLSRIYLFELPLAALTAASVWALLASNRFESTKGSLVFGLVGGLACVARAGGPALLAGPVLIYLIISLRRAPRGRKIINILIAGVVSFAIAATWYVPNWKHFTDYIYSVTYGDRASVYTVGGTSLTLRGAQLLFWGTILDGPGVPGLAFCIITYLTAAIWRRSLLFSKATLCVAAAFLIDFIVVIPASQQPGGVLLLAIIPALAILCIRAAAALPKRSAAAAAVLVTLIFGIHHLCALTWCFERPQPRESGFGPWPSFKIWNHRNAFLDIAGHAVEEKRWPEWIAKVADRLESLPIPDKAFIHLMVDHPFLQPNNLTLELLQRRREWTAVGTPWIPESAQKENRLSIRKTILYSRAVVIRSVPPESRSRFDDMVAFLLNPLVEGPAAAFIQIGKPIPCDNGCSLIVYQRKPDFEWRERAPENLTKAEAAFRPPQANKGGGPEIKLIGAAYGANDGLRSVELAFEIPAEITTIPPFRLHVTDLDSRVASKLDAVWNSKISGPRPQNANFAVANYRLEDALPPRFHERGFLLALAAGGDAIAEHYKIESELPVNRDEWIVTMGMVEPNPVDVQSRPTSRPLLTPPDRKIEIAGLTFEEQRWHRWISRTADALVSLNLPKTAFVNLLVDHPYLPPTKLSSELLQRGKAWTCVSTPLNEGYLQKETSQNLRKPLMYAKAIVTRSPPGGSKTKYDEMAATLLKPLIDGPAAGFLVMGDPIPCDDGASLVIYKKRPEVEWLEKLPPNLTTIGAILRSPPTNKDEAAEIKLIGGCYGSEDGLRRLELVFEIPPGDVKIPPIRLFTADVNHRIAAEINAIWDREQVGPRPPNAKYLRAHFRLEESLPRQLHEHGFLLCLEAGGAPIPEHYRIESDLPVNRDEWILTFGMINANPNDETYPTSRPIPLPLGIK